MWEGIEVFHGQDVAYINELMEARRIDYIITLWDIWLLANKKKFPKAKWVAYVPTDTNDLSTVLADVLKDTGVQLAMSKHGLESMRRAGFEPLYVPHGVDMTTLRPDAGARKEFRDSFGWDDETFVVGSVGLNYRDDRKGFIPLMQAFKTFHERHPQSRLYIHTDAGMKGGDALPFAEIARAYGISEFVAWPHQMSLGLGLIDEDWLRSVYNGMDVFCLPTRGEGFGICTVDAQACGVPVIVSDNTTGPELCKTGWLIDVDEDDLRWMPNGAWRYEPRASAVLARLEEAHDAWRDPDWAEFKEQARARILEYDWSAVWPKYYAPVFKMLGERLDGQA
jgi:glycosyltransferase involved in cell wall biosynthesis